MSPILSLALWLVPLASSGDPAPGDPSGDPAAQAEDTVLVAYDLRPLMPRWDAGGEWSQSLSVLPAASLYHEQVSVDDSLQYGELSGFELLELMTQILGDELRREGRELQVEGHMLDVLAPPALHEQVRAILDGLETALSGAVELRVDVLTLAESGGELAPAGPIGEDEAAKLVAALIARGARHESHSLSLAAGRTAQIDTRRRIPFLSDYDVEIAQAMMIFAPVMRDTSEGTRLVLRGAPLPGGVALATVLVRSELLSPIEKKTFALSGMVNPPEGSGPIEYVKGPDGVQSPEVLVRGLAFDTFLPDGKALVLTLEAALGTARTREVILLRRTGGTLASYFTRPIPRTNRTLIALDSELFRSPRLRSEADDQQENGGQRIPNLTAHFEGEVSSFLLEWVKARFSVWRPFGPWILIVTDPSWDRDAAAQLDRLVKTLRPVTALRDVRVDLRSQGREPAYPIRMRIPLLDGARAGFVLARGTTAVTGFDVEVAQGAAVPDPIVTSIFDGLALALSLQGSTLEASGTAQLYDRAIAKIESGYGALGPIERPEPRVLRFDERLELADGRPARIGSGSDRPDQPGLVLEISVAPPR